MAKLEERVADLEGHAEAQTRAIDGLRQDIADLRVELRSSVAEVRSEMATIRSDMALRSDIGDVRKEMGDLRNDMNRRSDLLDAKIDRHFVWLMGMMVTGFITVIGALVGVVYR